MARRPSTTAAAGCMDYAATLGRSGSESNTPDDLGHQVVAERPTTRRLAGREIARRVSGCHSRWFRNVNTAAATKATTQVAARCDRGDCGLESRLDDRGRDARGTGNGPPRRTF
jgi:hypothetical protein